jgi:hypothetical protein
MHGTQNDVLMIPPHLWVEEGRLSGFSIFEGRFRRRDLVWGHLARDLHAMGLGNMFLRKKSIG